MEEEKILGRSLCTQYPDFTNKEMKDQNAEWYVTGYSQVRPRSSSLLKAGPAIVFPSHCTTCLRKAKAHPISQETIQNSVGRNSYSQGDEKVGSQIWTTFR